MAISVVAKANVDGEPWVTVKVPRKVAVKVYAMHKYYWHRDSGLYLFDVPESALTFLRLLDSE